MKEYCGIVLSGMSEKTKVRFRFYSNKTMVHRSTIKKTRWQRLGNGFGNIFEKIFSHMKLILFHVFNQEIVEDKTHSFKVTTFLQRRWHILTGDCVISHHTCCTLIGLGAEKIAFVALIPNFSRSRNY